MDKPPVEQARRRVSCQCGGWSFHKWGCPTGQELRRKINERFMRRRHNDEPTDPDTLEREGWPESKEEDEKKRKARATETRKRNRQRQGKDNR